MSARPYAAALLCALWATLNLVLWAQSGLARYAVLYVFSAALAFYCHYLFAGIFAFHALYLAFYWRTWDERRKRMLGTSAIVLILLMLPGTGQVLSLAARRQSLFFSETPGLLDLLKAVMPLSVGVYLVAGCLVGYLLTPKRFERTGPLWRVSPMPRPVLITIISWWLVPPVVFFVYSRVGAESFFVERYFLWCSPALALAAASAVCSCSNRVMRHLIVGVIFLLILVREIDRTWQVEDWRTAAGLLEQEHRRTGAVVFLYSGLIEIEAINKWNDNDPEKRGYLAAPFSYYTVSFEPRLLPSRVETAAQRRYFDASLKEIVRAGQIFFLAALARKASSGLQGAQTVDRYYIGLLDSLGFKASMLGKTGPVRVIKFEPAAG